jgi:hypothetical protein
LILLDNQRVATTPCNTKGVVPPQFPAVGGHWGRNFLFPIAFNLPNQVRDF